jgi:ribosomal protein L16 Arg81 hydroxylase
VAEIVEGLEVIKEFTLKQGDVLYMPRGVIHQVPSPFRAFPRWSFT